MEPITLTIIGSALFYAIDRARERRASKISGAPPLPDPVKFTPAQLARFTHLESGVRIFDADVAERVIAPFYASRSAIPVDDPDLARRNIGRAWRVAPLTPGLSTIADLFDVARKEPGSVVLGSLSLVLLPVGSPACMLVFVGGPGSLPLAGEQGDFAVLRPPAISLPKSAPMEEVVTVETGRAPQKTVQAKNGAPNGVSAPAVAPVIVSPTKET